MFIQIKMVTILLIIVYGCIVVAEEIDNCDRVQFSFNDQTGTNNIQNFTKQSFNKSGKPVFYSVFGPQKKWRYSVVWWNNKDNKWLSQTKRRRPRVISISNKITKAKLKISHQIGHILVFLN